jgi:adenylyltransferase/sulfurtransferase
MHTTQDLSVAEVDRFSRHLMLPEVGKPGQLRLRNSRVLLIGAGGLGCPVGLYLGAAGVGTIGIVDDDAVELSNLQRQVSHTTADVGRSKAQSLAESLRAIHPQLELQVHQTRFLKENALELCQKYDVIVDCSDNFATRYLCNDAAYFAHKPLVSATVYRFQGQLSVFVPSSGLPCYRCLYPVALPPSLAPT